MAATIDTNYGKTNVKSKVYSSAIDIGTNLFSNYLSNLFGDTDWGRLTGTIFSNGMASAGNTISNNLLKGSSLLEGLPKDVGSTLAGTGAGIVSNYIGQGISDLGGNSMLSRGIGQGVATGLGAIGGQTLSNLIKGKGATNTITNSIKAIKAGKGATDAGLKAASFAGKANLIGLGGQVIGSGLGAAFGSSNEYGGKHGNITQTMDTVYDIALGVVGTLGPVGALVSGGMALNKGLSNAFGSTDGMTKNDAVLGSAFMPFFVKWANVLSGNTTDKFENLNLYTVDRVNLFMGNAYGDVGKRFQTAREESEKTYGGGFLGIGSSQDAYEEAQNNINFANNAFSKMLTLADLNERQNIRAYDMSSINNLRYAQRIQGGYKPRVIGKHGMKIFNNATNHNIGMRLLSAAALIDNKQIILCSAVD